MADIRKLIQTGPSRDSMRSAFPILNMVIDSANESLNTANEAKADSDYAVQTADTANTKSDSTQAQLDTIIIESGTSNAETLQARTDGSANTFNTLQARLNNSDTQLAEIAYTNVSAHTGTDSEKLNSFLSAHAGKTVRIPRGSYAIDTTVVVPAETEVIAEGVLFSSSSHITILELNSGVKLSGVEIQGAGNSVADTGGVGIHLSGVDANNYASDVKISNCNIHDIGFRGILVEFAENVLVEKNQIANIGYAAISGLSVNEMKVSKNKITNVSPGSSGNAYGVVFSRRTTDTTSVYPNSENCLAENNIIKDITIWEALDTHAGINIVFSKNTIRNCKVGVAIVTDGNGNAPQKCKALNNDIIGIGTGEGIKVTGIDASNKSYLCEIIGNVLEECGEQTNNISGAILFNYTIGCVVASNILRNCYTNGVTIGIENTGFNVNGNTIIDTQDSTYSAATGINVRYSNNRGTINGNTLLRVNDALNTYTAEQGIRLSTSVGNYVSIGVNSNNYVIPMSGVDGAVVDYGSFSNASAKLFAGLGTPEAVITAPVGSIYLRRDGGVGTSFYVKESGVGNTGWVPK
jgi:hypothetical protein